MEVVEDAAVFAQGSFGDRDFAQRVGLNVHQFNLTEQVGSRFGGVVDLDEVRFVGPMPQQIEAPLVAARIEEVAHHDGQSAALRSQHEAVHDAAEVRVGPLRFELLQKTQQRQNAVLAAREREVAENLLRVRDDRHAIEVRQCDVRQRRRHLPREIELGWFAKCHAARTVEQEIDVQVFLLLKPLQQQIAMPRVDVPVEMPEVVTGRVLAMVGELDPAPHLLRPPLSQQRPAKDSPRDQRQIFQLLQKTAVEEHEAIL